MRRNARQRLHKVKLTAEVMGGVAGSPPEAMWDDEWRDVNGISGFYTTRISFQPNSTTSAQRSEQEKQSIPSRRQLLDWD